MPTSPERLARIHRLWKRAGGKGFCPHQDPKWGPPFYQSPRVMLLVEEGWLRRVNGRCGFEAFPDMCLEWTEVGAAAMRLMDAQED